MGRVSSQTLAKKSGPMLPHSYTTLAQLVSGTPSASSLYENPIWSSNSMPTSSLFIPNMTSKIQIVITSVPIQLTIPLQPLLSFQPSILVQPTVSFHASVSSSVPLLSGKNVPPPYS